MDKFSTPMANAVAEIFSGVPGLINVKTEKYRNQVTGQIDTYYHWTYRSRDGMRGLAGKSYTSKERIFEEIEKLEQESQVNCAHSLVTIEEVKTDSPVGFDGDVIYSDHVELIGTCSACGKKFSEEEMLNSPALMGLLIDQYQPETVEDR